jgi:hypothetical protein
VRPRRSSRATARSTGSAGRASTPARASPRCSAPRSTADGCSPRRPAGAHDHARYRRDTLILETTIETDDGAVTVVDFMPLRGALDVVRLVRGVGGAGVPMRTELVCASTTAPPCRGSAARERHLRAIAGPDMVVLRTPVALRGEDLTTVGEFTVERGQRVSVRAHHGPSHLRRRPGRSTRAARRHGAFWTEWAAASRTRASGATRSTRSLITLKALTYARPAASVAAPTTSLPEHVGGTRNWDYRFCWLRDATLTLLALMNAGYYDEAQAWRDWLLRAAAGIPVAAPDHVRPRPASVASEYEVPWLPGLRALAPVRIGNAAHGTAARRLSAKSCDRCFQARTRWAETRHADWTSCARPRAPASRCGIADEGIWEIAAASKHFTYSKVMAWVALDRGIRASRSIQGRRARSTAGASVRQTHSCESLPSAGTTGAGASSVLRLEDLDASLLLHSDDRLSCQRPTTRPRHHRRRRSATVRRLASCVATTACNGRRLPPAKGRSSPAASGWWTRCVLSGREAVARVCSSACLR